GPHGARRFERPLLQAAVMLFHDLRLALRVFRRQPAFAAMAVLALGLGLGLTATMWRIVYGGILRGLPYEEASRVMHVSRVRPAQPNNQMDVPINDFDAWRREQHSFDQFGAGYSGTVNVAGLEGPAERFQGAYMTPAMLALPRVRPLIG